jgi:hypothetical protein
VIGIFHYWQYARIATIAEIASNSAMIVIVVNMKTARDNVLDLFHSRQCDLPANITPTLAKFTSLFKLVSSCAVILEDLTTLVFSLVSVEDRFVFWSSILPSQCVTRGTKIPVLLVSNDPSSFVITGHRAGTKSFPKMGCTRTDLA